MWSSLDKMSRSALDVCLVVLFIRFGKAQVGASNRDIVWRRSHGFPLKSAAFAVRISQSADFLHLFRFCLCNDDPLHDRLSLWDPPFLMKRNPPDDLSA